jgi:transposase
MARVKRYRSYHPSQSYLLPPSPSEWLPEGHLVYFVLDLVAELDLSAIERAVQARDPRGERPYAPQMMTALLLYGYATGVFSSRRIARATYEDVGFRVLSGGEHPHFTTVNGFRATHRAALAELFVQVLRLCRAAGLAKLGQVAIDGTKMKANASKHKAMSYERMQQDEARLKAEIEALLARADAADSAEDAQYGAGQEPEDVPAELKRREDRLARIRAARAGLEREAAAARAAELIEQADELRATAAHPGTSASASAACTTRAAQHDQQAAELDDDDRDPPPSGPDDDLPRHTPPTERDGTPKPNAQRNFTDPESRIMMRDGGFLQGFNAQIAVDEDHQIIVAAAVGNQAPDAQYFAPMLERIVDNCDEVPTSVTADTGYFSADNVRAAEHMGAEPFMATGRQRRGRSVEDLPESRPSSEAAQRMRATLNDPRGRAIYARRKATVEPVFGQIRAVRGFHHFSFRGLWKTRCEWMFVCLTHNLLKLYRATSGGCPIAQAA